MYGEGEKEYNLSVYGCERSLLGDVRVIAGSGQWYVFSAEGMKEDGDVMNELYDMFMSGISVVCDWKIARLQQWKEGAWKDVYNSSEVYLNEVYAKLMIAVWLGEKFHVTFVKKFAITLVKDGKVRWAHGRNKYNLVFDVEAEAREFVKKVQLYYS